MSAYALWNNKGGVGKSYLTFQLSAEYARSHPDRKVLVLDMCPQANSSSMLLGGMESGEQRLDSLSGEAPRRTIAGYVRERIASPYHNPGTGANYLTQVSAHNVDIPSNLYLVVGDEELEILASRVRNATQPGPDDAWPKVHLWIRELISDIRQSWNVSDSPVFIDCNPSFTVYTEVALAAADRLIIPFSADGSSKRAVRTVLALLYGVTRIPGGEISEFASRCRQFNLRVPSIYCYVGNRLTQYLTSAQAFRAVVRAIGKEIWDVWRRNPNHFSIHPTGSEAPTTERAFRDMFQFEVVDANTASVVSSSLGIPITALTAGQREVAGLRAMVNQSQLERQQPNIRELVARIE